jgi:hypothetical protein
VEPDTGPVEPPQAQVDTPPARERRNFRAAVQDWWDSNPIRVGLGVAVGVIVLIVSVGLNIFGLIRDNDLAAANSRLEQERLEHQAGIIDLQGQIDTLEQSLGSIRLSIGPDTNYFDVTRLIVQRETRNEVPATSATFDDGRFFATPEGTSPWTYEETTELNSTAEVYGLTDEEFRAGYGQLLAQQGLTQAQIDDLLDEMSNLVVHRWQTGPDKLIEDSDQQLNVPTQVLVERVNHDRYVEILSGLTPVPGQLYSRDESGLILQSQLLTRQLSGQFPLINSLQKQGDIAYAAIETPLFDVTVNGDPFDEYVLHEDMLIISTPSDAYLIRRIVADEGRSADAALLNQWLDEFRVCENC